MNLTLSELDLRRFGNITAKADGLASKDDVAACLAFCAQHDAKLLIARVDTALLDVAQALEASGGMLCDTLVYYELRLRHAAASPDSEFSTRTVAPQDREGVIDIARESFSDYYGHYHSDPRLERSACDETYVSWCESTLDKVGEEHDVLVIEDAAGICGFLTLRRHDASRLELVLSGIRQAYSGRGVYRRLIEAGVRYAADRNMKRVFTSTQISNRAVQWVWLKQGFLPTGSTYTFHVWR